MQSERRTNPYPWTWEIPVLAFVLVLLVMVMAVHAGRFVAVLVSYGGVALPTREGFITSAVEVLTGQAGAGLSHPLTVHVSAPMVWLCVGVAEVVALLGCVVAIRWGWLRWGRGRLLGMASSVEAQRSLGLYRLRKVAPVVRPDLYGKVQR